MEIKMLGPGCPKCRTAAERVEEVIRRHGIDASVTRVEDIAEIMSYGIMLTPASWSMGRSSSQAAFPGRPMS